MCFGREVVEVREYKVNLKADPIVDLICSHPSSNQKVNYRIHSTPEGKVTKVEIEKKVKGKNAWVELEKIAYKSFDLQAKNLKAHYLIFDTLYGF